LPELPEVEVVRVGLAPAMRGARVAAVEVRDQRALKRHIAGSFDFERRMVGAVFSGPVRRGKFLWVPIRSNGSVGPVQQDPGIALLAHLGMSGQLLLRGSDAADDRHVRVRLWLEHPQHGEMRLDFADQRLFGSLAIDGLVPTRDGLPAGMGSEQPLIPAQAAHIARDPLDPAFDDDAVLAALRARRTAVKRALLDQGLLSGVGNIYADEALWRARLHPERPSDSLNTRSARLLLAAIRDVFTQALAEGGTSFDAQYVNVNGQAGYFAHSLNAYGRGGEPCPRCGGAITRAAFMNRSSHYCPRCQRRRGSA
jgi:formamidopyrimidine-DNA glycosylase